MVKERRLLTRMVAFAIAAMVGVAGLAIGTATVDAAVKAPAKVKNVKVTAIDHHSAKITWKKVKDAKKYEVYRAEKKNGKYKKVKTTKKVTFKDNQLGPNMRYYYKVRAVNGKKKGAFSAKKFVDIPMPSEFYIGPGDESGWEGVTFDQDITIYIDKESTAENFGVLAFDNCTFNGDIKVVGDKSGRVIFNEGCVFGEGCEITVVEATEGAKYDMTLADDFMKLIINNATAPAINTEAVCNVVMCGNLESVVVDGVKYLKSDFGDFQYCYIATYYENGEKTVWTGAE